MSEVKEGQIWRIRRDMTSAQKRRLRLNYDQVYVYSLLYLVVEVQNDYLVWVKRLDQHRKYMVSPYTFVGKWYLQRWGKVVREDVDVAPIQARKSHHSYGYSGLLS